MRRKSLKRVSLPVRSKRRGFTEEFKREAVQMLLDGHKAGSVAERLGLAGLNLLYCWKREQLEQTGPVATSLEARRSGVGSRAAPRRARTRHFKKSVGYFWPARIAEVYAAVEAIVQANTLSIATACEALEVSRSAYYAWRSNGWPSACTQQDAEIDAPGPSPVLEASTAIWSPTHRRHTLHDLGQPCGPRRVAKLLKSQGLRAIQPEIVRSQNHREPTRPGLQPQLAPGGSAAHRKSINCGSVTLLGMSSSPRRSAFSYLAMLMDRYSRSIVGWRLDETMTEDSSVLPALRMAIRDRQPPARLIPPHRSRAANTPGARYRDILRRANFQQSMSRVANCYENAFMESCFGTIKTELEMTEYENPFARLSWEIAEYIDYYQTERKHSALDYLTPQQFESLRPPPKQKN